MLTARDILANETAVGYPLTQPSPRWGEGKLSQLFQPARFLISAQLVVGSQPSTAFALAMPKTPARGFSP